MAKMAYGLKTLTEYSLFESAISSRSCKKMKELVEINCKNNFFKGDK